MIFVARTTALVGATIRTIPLLWRGIKTVRATRGLANRTQERPGSSTTQDRESYRLCDLNALGGEQGRFWPILHRSFMKCTWPVPSSSIGQSEDESISALISSGRNVFLSQLGNKHVNMLT